MGRPAKTIRQHLLHGTVPQGKPDKPSLYQGGRPKFPAHLSRVGRQEMKRLVRILEARGTATEGDYAIAAMYGEVYARWISCLRQIDDLMVTTTITDNHGTAAQAVPLSSIQHWLKTEKEIPNQSAARIFAAATSILKAGH